MDEEESGPSLIGGAMTGQIRNPKWPLGCNIRHITNAFFIFKIVKVEKHM